MGNSASVKSQTSGNAYRPSEVGFYGTLMTFGIGIGYNFDNGLSVNIYDQVSAGVAAYGSYGFTASFTEGFKKQYNAGVGVGTVTGMPGMTAVGVGAGISRRAEFGL